ncbi:MAG: DNA repair protein RecO [candidate division WS6 bacterium OLB20]|uniref:DNA repair protein RecO n=1 Tax=candidate division WS6 bacterium OLB20 TaxID=1617426 RepID=A0A136M0R8_9BACT|nr:MAG: DNA repair protein RecO [candidate division WS6 bacterium OLB20]
MRSYKDTGYIIKVRQLREADKLVVLFTKDKGRIETVAKGASRLLSRKSSSIDLLNRVTVNLYQGKQLDVITEIALEDDYASVKQDLAGISQVFYILELLDVFTRYLPEHDTLFAMLEDFLQLFTDKSTRITLLRSFELKLLDIFGFGPDLYHCLHSGSDLKPGERRVSASSGQAGYLRLEALPNKPRSPVLIGDDIVKVQRYLLHEDLGSARHLAITQNQQNTLQSVQRNWMQGILERSLKSMNFIDEINARHAQA